jgi:hypothetical protein
METNLRLVYFGDRLRVSVKRYDLTGQVLDKDQVERFCTILGRETGVPAVPYMIDGQWKSVITEQRYTVERRKFPVDEWVVNVEPTSQEFSIAFSNVVEQQLVADLYKRALLIQIAAKTDMWTLGTPRIFYEKDPFLKNDFVKKFRNLTDIQGFRRYEISEQPLNGVGLAFSVHVSTAFFTNLTVEDYFVNGHADRFRRLAGRQREQKGTLMYDGPKGKQVCYFEEYCPGKTLATSGEIQAKTKRYASVYAYYQETAPDFPVEPGDKIAIVKFSGSDAKSMVPANKLYLRVMNELLDHHMSQKDKINPQERTELLSRFWQQLGRAAFGPHLAFIETKVYQPASENSGQLSMPGLIFGNNIRLATPQSASDTSYRKHFNDRKACLDEAGCYYVPPMMTREIHFAFPQHISEHLAEFFAKEVCDKVAKLTGITVDPVIHSYPSYMDMTTDLMLNYRPGMVVFTFDDGDSVTYFNIRHELSGWRLKRLTSYELARKYKAYREYMDGPGGNWRAQRDWESFVDENSYDVLQQLGCLPYVFDTPLNYDMQLVIDVSAKSSYLALSLFMYKPGMPRPISSELIKPKTDAKTEAINRIFLEKYLKQLITENKDTIRQYGLNSLLVLRDGKDCGEEFEAIRSAIDYFIQNGLFAQDFRFDFVEYHKSSLKQVRIWEKKGHIHVNCLEGSYLRLDLQTAILTTTGAGTLNQGTASPVLIRNKYTNADLMAVLNDIFVTSQLNFSSPRVAQRLTFPAKRTDEQLKDRMAQEILRIK